MPKFAVILPAAGSSTRFGGRQSKLVADLAGLPVIARAVAPFIHRSDSAEILVAVPNETPPRGDASGDLAKAPVISSAGRTNEIWEALSRDPSIRNRLGGQIALVPGGACRAESVRSAARRVPKSVEWIAIHDAARPLISQDLIDRTFAAAVEHGAAAPAVAVQLTIKQAPGPLPAKVEQTVPRDRLWAIQTPQFIRRDLLLQAFSECVYPMEKVTDDLQLLELTGHPCWLVAGEESNIKITTPQDLLLAQLLLARR